MLVVLCSSITPVFASVEADIMKQIDTAGNSAGYVVEEKDPRIFIAEFIQVLLSITGTLFIILMVFAGYVRVTAQGDDDRIKKSNNTAVAAIIGLSIVMLAYGITVFVTARIYNAATYEPVYEENNAAPNTTFEKNFKLELN